MKYGNKKTIVDGITFDSKKEAKRYQELMLLQNNGEISNLQRQVKYELIPKQRDANGKAIRQVSYIVDFVYEKQRVTVAEDAKGFRTPDYIIKNKLMLYVHGITILET